MGKVNTNPGNKWHLHNRLTAYLTDSTYSSWLEIILYSRSTLSALLPEDPPLLTLNEYYDLWILHIEQINKLQICEFMYRFAHNLFPFTFLGYFCNISDL